MSYRIGERNQAILFPQTIDEYVKENDPVRVYDMFIESLDFNELGIIVDDNQVGNPAYFPKSMMKLVLYGYSYGQRSSRELERATYHNISFIWLMGGLKPDHKTIANFRRNNKPALKKVLKECARLCIKLKLIEGNTLFVDSSKIRANASIKNMWSEERCREYLAKIDQQIEKILQECDEKDESEKNHESLVKINEELGNKTALKEKVQQILADLKKEGTAVINSVDKDCVKVKGRQGSHAGYSGQIVVDEKHGLIVSSDVVSENNDDHQFSRQITQANEVTGKVCEVACGDAGYANTDNVKESDAAGITVIVPTHKQATGQEPTEFAKERFKYAKEKDEYVCPAGQILKFRGISNRKNHRQYRITKAESCLKCQHYGVCTKSRDGRQVIRIKNEEIKEKLEKQYESAKGQEVYKLRKSKVELPFGHIKRNLKMGGFLLRGVEGVKAEMSLLSSCFNIVRMITILGTKELTSKLTA